MSKTEDSTIEKIDDNTISITKIITDTQQNNFTLNDLKKKKQSLQNAIDATITSHDEKLQKLQDQMTSVDTLIAQAEALGVVEVSK